jgi:meso-butanediol dehydrogenase / (S,S)-butanediol dehydrogenase / diacetyl reductase
MADLQGRTAVVTGAGSGLGAALARMLAEAGADVALLDIDADAAAANARTIAEETGVTTTSARCDVGDTASVVTAAEHVRVTLGGCDILCSNVGVQQFGAIDKLTDQDWQWILNVNVVGSVRTVREFLPMLRAGSGFRRIVFTASSSVLAPSVRLGAYQTSKFAVLGFADSLREELTGDDIGVTVLFPGGMMTRHLESSVQARPAELGESLLDMADVDAMIAHQPMDDGDLATPEHAIRNLLDDLVAGEPYVITHGSFRPLYDQRRDAIDAAFDRMEAS